MMILNHEPSRPDTHPHRRRTRRAARRREAPVRAFTPILRTLIALVAAVGLALATPAGAAGGPHYDVPAGYTRCPDAKAWHGFFKWASVRHTGCGEAARVMRAYAAKVKRRMPHSVDGYRCRIFYWRNQDGDIYASRHTCTDGAKVVRFYGMV
jgi:hypothetical protein